MNLDCGGKAQRRHRFSAADRGSKAAWRYASRRSPKNAVAANAASGLSVILGGQHIPTAVSRMSGVSFGIDRVLAAPDLLRGKLGLVTNDAARTAADSQLHSRLALQHAGFELVRLFSPEHGIAANAADGTAVADAIDPLTGLPIVSLYGERMRPPRESLTDLDAMLFDVPDIGARFYTYIWTLSHVLEACADAGVPLVVLDRPNPLSGDLAAAEGPILDTEKFSSFVGRAAIPIRHSLTMGELAQLWNAEWKLNAKLRIIRCAGWQRAMHWPDTGLPFVPTSPAITSYEAALLYPGLCLFEGTNLSVGRGTPLAFHGVGAPWLRAREVVGRFNECSLGPERRSPIRHESDTITHRAGSETGAPPIAAEAASFIPQLPPYIGERCEAVRLLVHDAKAFRPVAAGLRLMATIIELHREEFRWAQYPTAANPGGEGHFERLVGRAGIRETLEADSADLDARVKEWTEATGWRDRVRCALLYD